MAENISIDIENDNLKLLQKLTKIVCDEKSKFILTSDLKRIGAYNISPMNSITYFSLDGSEIGSIESTASYFENSIILPDDFIKDIAKIAGAKGKIKLTLDSKLRILEAKSGAKKLSWNANKVDRTTNSLFYKYASSAIVGFDKSTDISVMFPDFHIKNNPGQSNIFNDISGIFEDDKNYYSTNGFSLIVSNKEKETISLLSDKSNGLESMFWPSILISILSLCQKHKYKVYYDSELESMFIYGKNFVNSIEKESISRTSSIYERSKSIFNGSLEMFLDPTSNKTVLSVQDLLERIDSNIITSFEASKIRISSNDNAISISIYNGDKKIDLSFDDIVGCNSYTYDIYVSAKDFLSLLSCVAEYATMIITMSEYSLNCKFGDNMFICTYTKNQ